MNRCGKCGFHWEGNSRVKCPNCIATPIYFVEYYIRGSGALPKNQRFSDLEKARKFAKDKKTQGNIVTILQAQDNQEIWQAKGIEFL
ncbi:hypothetical protein LCGC14_0608960 [marine sediment metagenome]|uniref:Uncharacterized protein n=1 Tax=marine sediment metagenome TaxID=412755 RepID=A0A0F9UGR2_9ZZZZ